MSLKYLFCNRYYARHVPTLFQLLITTILNVFANEEVDLEELNISPRSTQLGSGESRNLNPDVSASKGLLFPYFLTLWLTLYPSTCCHESF